MACHTAVGTTTWSYTWTLPSEDYVSHTVWSRATDSATNVETPSSNRQVWVDTVFPVVGSFQIAGGAAYTSTTGVTLNNSVSDGSPSMTMRFSNDGVSWSTDAQTRVHSQPMRGA